MQNGSGAAVDDGAERSVVSCRLRGAAGDEKRVVGPECDPGVGTLRRGDRFCEFEARDVEGYDGAAWCVWHVGDRNVEGL